MFFILNACAMEDNAFTDIGLESFEKNNGYLPLATNNFWVYENRVAELNEDQNVWQYNDDYSAYKNEVFISKARLIKINNTDVENEFRVYYGLSPINDRGFLGGLLGNVEQIYKNPITGEYINTEYVKMDVTPLDENNKSVEDKLTLVLKDHNFLNDNAEVGDILFDKIEIVKDEGQGGVSTIEYRTTTEVVGKYSKIPLIYASNDGIDSHLLNFNDIVHVRDKIEIVKITNQSYGLQTEILGKISLLKDDDSKLKVHLNTDASGEGPVFATIILEIGIPFTDIVFFEIPIPIPFPITVRSNYVDSLNADATIDLDICPAESDINFNDSRDITLDVVSNQVPFIRDVFYAKNVGKIKTITSVRKISGKIQLDAYDIPSVPIDLQPTESGCIKIPNTAELDVTAGINTDKVFLNVPLLFGDNYSLISNIKSYSVK